MRKSTKIAVVLAAAALLVAGFAFTTLAKGWVKEAEGLYYYEDEYGMKVYNEWKKDTDANGKVNYYYLGDDGYMVTDSIVEYNDEKYWVGADGAKVTEQWIKVPADQEDIDNYDVDYRWYYFQKSNGKAYKGVKKDIEGSTYFFGNDGKMLFGYVSVDADGKPSDMTTDVVKAHQGNTYLYYCGSNDEGKVLKSEWRKETNVDSSAGAYETEESWWAFYQSNGKRADSTLSNGALWKGQRYYFDSEGMMIHGWDVATRTNNPDVFTARYFGGEDDGKMVKKAWAYVKPSTGGDDKFWFWFDGAGTAYTVDKTNKAVVKIDGKFYAFGDPDKGTYASKMLSGPVMLSFTDNEQAGVVTNANRATKVGDEIKALTLKDWLAYEDSIEGAVRYFYYFSGDGATDGSMKKNVTFSQEFVDDTYTLAVGNDGRFKNGYVSKEKKFYRNGYLLAASEDMRYEVVYVWNAEIADGNFKDYALLGVAGAEVAKKATVVDADGSYYYVDKDGKIFKADSSSLSAAKVIASYRTNGVEKKVSIDGHDYTIVPVDKTGYTELTLKY